jgi:hypothetical protein
VIPLPTPPPLPKPDTLKRIDDLIHAGFEAYRSSCFNWLLAATGLVVVGLWLEGPELCHEITSIVRHWRFTRRFHFSVPENHVPNWAKLAAFLGWLFIIVGVAGEYVADSFVSKADGFVQTFDEILLRESQTRTAFATERASAAFERAAQTEKEAAEDLKATNIARQKAEEARAKAGGLEFQIADAKRDAAEANRTAESERRARGELQKELQPRRLNGEQKKKLTALLSDTPEPIGIFSNGFDVECSDFANDIGGALNNAGWKTTFIPSFTREHGVEIGTTKESDMTLLMPIMLKLKNALLAVGVLSRISFFDRKSRGTATELEKNVLYLAIDNKPEIAPAAK